MTTECTPRIIFAQTLAKCRHSQHLSQEGLVAQLNLQGSLLSREMYKYIETGRGNIKVSDLIALQKVYGIPFEEFFTGLSPSALPKSSITMLLLNPLFCQNLITLRKRHSYTQQALVDQMNLLGSPISRRVYSMIETNVRHLKTTDLVCIKEIYHISYSEFFERAGYENN